VTALAGRCSAVTVCARRSARASPSAARWVDGLSIDIGATRAKAAIGYVPQDLAIYPDLSARENLRFFGRLQRMGGRELDRRVDEVLDLIGLAGRAKDRTDSFSGGMKRRLNIGIGLFHRPKLLVLDEPTVGADPQSRRFCTPAQPWRLSPRSAACRCTRIRSGRHCHHRNEEPTCH